MSMVRKKLGGTGESVAADFLKESGYRILNTNVHTSYGELDIIALDNDTLVFVEVKTRRSEKYGHPFDAITPHKQRAILKSSMDYINKNGYSDIDYRFDAVAVLFNPPQNPKVELIKNAFEFDV